MVCVLYCIVYMLFFLVPVVLPFDPFSAKHSIVIMLSAVGQSKDEWLFAA